MTRFFCLIFLCFSTAIVHPEEPSEKGVAVRFLAQQVPTNLGKIVLATEENRSAPFDLPVNNLSAPQETPARTFSVWSVDRNLSLATVTLPEEGKSFITLLIPSPKGGYSPVVMRSDTPSFKPGDIYFHNSTSKTVLGFVGTARFTLPPGRGTVLEPKGARAEKFYDVGLGVREKDGNRVLCTTRWPEDNQARFYVFFYVDPTTRRVAYRAVDEFILPKLPNPAAAE